MKSSVKTSALAELLEQHLKFRTIENVAASAPNPDALKRRMFDILHGKTEEVTLRVADEIATVCGRPDWLQFI